MNGKITKGNAKYITVCCSNMYAICTIVFAKSVIVLYMRILFIIFFQYAV